MTEQTCRCCLTKVNEQSVSFRLNMKESNDGTTLRDKLVECIPEMTISTTSADVICVSCVALLTSAYNFRKMCLKTDEQFKGKESVKNVSDGDVIKENSGRKELNSGQNNHVLNSVNLQTLTNKLTNCTVSLNLLPQKVIDSAEEGNVIYICDRCKTLFLQYRDYFKHVTEETNSCGQCKQCGIKFRSNTIYEMHMKFMHSQRYSVYRLSDEKKKPVHVINSTVTKPLIHKTPSKILNFKQSKINVKQSKINVKQSKINVKQSKINVKQSNINVKQSKINVKQSKINVKQSNINVKQSNINVKQSKINVKQSTTNVNQSKTTVKQSKINVKQMLSNKNKNRSEKAKVKKFKCIFCTKFFLNTTALQRHLSWHDNYYYRCLECGRMEMDTELHFILTKCKSTEFAPPTFTDTRCPFCYKHFPTVQQLRDHVKWYTNFRKYCFTCKMHFKTVWEMTLHHINMSCGSTQILNDLKGDIKCPVCNKSFLYKHGLQHHYLTHRTNTIVCSVCTKPFYTTSAYIEHQNHCHHSSDMVTELDDENIDIPEVMFVKAEEASVVETVLSTPTVMESTSYLVDPLTSDEEQVASTSAKPENVNDHSYAETIKVASEITENLQNIIEKIGKDQVIQVTENRANQINEDDLEIEQAVRSIILQIDPDNLPEQDTEMVSSTT